MALSPTLVKLYKSLLVNLLPMGRLWQAKEQPVFNDLLESFATELCRVDERIKDLLREADPRVTDELIDDWERLMGLPDECTPDGLDLAERRQQIVQKLTTVGALSVTFFEFVGAQLGFDITVTNRISFLAGRAVAGDPLTNYFERVFEAGDVAGTPLQEVGWLYYFEVNMPIAAAEIFEAGDVAGTPLREFSNPLIECTMLKLKPAHSAIFFTFS